MSLASSPPPRPADCARAAPETPFQVFTRDLGLQFQAAVRSPVPLEPVIDEMRALLDAVPDDQRNHMAFDGSWSDIVLLIETGADTRDRTPWMDACPRLESLMDMLGGPAGGAVVARIGPGDLLDWHYDPLSADGERVRLHLPIVTAADAVTDFCHERAHWPVGALYYGDYGFPHRVHNTAAHERIHLYFDVPAEPVRDLLPKALTAPRPGIRQEAVGLWLGWR